MVARKSLAKRTQLNILDSTVGAISAQLSLIHPRTESPAKDQFASRLSILQLLVNVLIAHQAKKVVPVATTAWMSTTMTTTTIED
jgi:hypothetical protein